MDLKTLVDKVMEQKKLTGAAVARVCSLSKDHVNAIRRGDRTRLQGDTVAELAKGLDINPRIILDRNGIADGQQLALWLARETVLPWSVPRFTSGAALTGEEEALNPIPLVRSPATALDAGRRIGEDEIVGYFHTESAAKNASGQLFALEITDEAMTPAYPIGSVVVIDRSVSDPQDMDGKVCACRVRGGLVIRTLHRTQRGYFLEALNPSYQRKHGTIEVPEGQLEFIGEVVLWHKFDGREV